MKIRCGFLCVFLYLFGAVSMLTAQTIQTAEAVTKKDLKEYVKILSGPEYEGRGTGEPGQVKAALYLGEQFRRLGLQPLDSSFLCHFPLYVRYRGECYIKQGKNVLRNFEGMFSLGGIYTEQQEVGKELIFGGEGDTLLLNQMDLKGKIVALLVPNLRATSTLSAYLIQKGAYAVFWANPMKDTQFESMLRTYKEHALARHYSLSSEHRVMRFKQGHFYSVPASEVPQLGEYYLRVSDLAGFFGTNPGELKKVMAQKQLQEIQPVPVSVKSEMISEPVTVANVIGQIPSEGDSTIIVTAHYDHLGKINGVVYPGADDNASGVSGMLGVIQNSMNCGKKPKYKIVFVATTAEEKGLLGASYFLDSTAVSFKIKANINLDMLGRSSRELDKEGKLLYVLTPSGKEVFGPAIKKLDEKYKFLFISGLSDYSSDHEVFYKKKIPSVFFFSGVHEDLHRPTDVWNRLDYNKLYLRTEAATELLQAIAFY